MWGWRAGGEGDLSGLCVGASRSGAALAGGSPAGGMLGLWRQSDRAGTLRRAAI